MFVFLAISKHRPVFAKKLFNQTVIVGSNFTFEVDIRGYPFSTPLWTRLIKVNGTWQKVL